MTSDEARVLLTGLRARFDERSLRERALITATAVAVVFALFDTCLLRPLEVRQAALAGRIGEAEAELASLNDETRALANTFSVEPNRPLLEDETALAQQIEVLDRRLGERMDSLIPPADMVSVLESLLAHERDLELVRLESGEAVPIVEARPDGDAAPREDGRPTTRLYRHELVMEFAGVYLSALRYLEAIETLPWRFFWDRLEYRVLEHPRARVTIRLYTLSSQEDWIGV